MKINAIDKSGFLKEYDTILTYYSDEFAKNYVVYTDNTYNSDNELQLYISEYNPESYGSNPAIYFTAVFGTFGKQSEQLEVLFS